MVDLGGFCQHSAGAGKKGRIRVRMKTEPSQKFWISFPAAHPDPQPLPDPHPSLFPTPNTSPFPSLPGFYLHPARQEKVLEELRREWRSLYGGTSIPGDGSQRGRSRDGDPTRTPPGALWDPAGPFRRSRWEAGAGGELTPSPHEYSMRIPRNLSPPGRPSPAFPKNRGSAGAAAAPSRPTRVPGNLGWRMEHPQWQSQVGMDFQQSLNPETPPSLWKCSSHGFPGIEHGLSLVPQTLCPLGFHPWGSPESTGILEPQQGAGSSLSPGQLPVKDPVTGELSMDKRTF